MDRREPVFAPEWRKTGGMLAGGGNANRVFGSPALCSDDPPVWNHARKSFGSGNDHQKNVPVLRRTTSSDFRRNSYGSNASHSRPYSSFGRNRRDRAFEGIRNYSDKPKLFLRDDRQLENSDPLGNILPIRFGKDLLHRTQSMIREKPGDMRPKKVSPGSKNNDDTGNGLLASGDGIFPKTTFEQEFPSLGTDERRGSTEPVRVSSPGLGSTIQTLPVSTSPVVASDSWKSALAEAPAVTGSSAMGVSSTQQIVSATSASATVNIKSGLNMAETLALGPSRVRTPPEADSRGHGRLDSPKIPNEGRLQVLKPSGVSLTAKDSLKPTNGSKAVNTAASITPSAAEPSVRSSRSRPNHISANHYPSVLLPTVEKRPASQTESKTDFFNKLKNKIGGNSNSSMSDSGYTLSQSISEKSDGLLEVASGSYIEQGGGAPPSAIFDDLLSNNTDEIIQNAHAYNDSNRSLSIGDKNLKFEMIPEPNGEEAAFLRSLGWEWDDTPEDEGEGVLTEEEINGFYVKVRTLNLSLKPGQGMRPAMTENIHGGASISSDSDSDS